MSEKPPEKSRSLANIAGIVAIATLISKIFGLLRELITAAAFGVGSVVNAYQCAYTIPGFLLILLGGINGPFHSALVSVLEKREKSAAAPIVESVTTIVSVCLLIVTVIVIVFAGILIDIFAPGLKEDIRANAILQLQVMAPLALLSGLIGIGFGTLNAANQYWLPSISPLFSSISVIGGIGILFFLLGNGINAPQNLTLGGLVLAGGTVAGALWQWIAQLIAQSKAGMGKFRWRFDWRIPGVMDVLKVMGPATLASGMLQINVATALFFASFIPDAPAAMRYANFIVLTPLGIISNMILVPLLPVFSRLAAPENWPELKERIRQGLFLTALTMLPLTAIFVSLSVPIIKITYQRGAFDVNATSIVAPVLMAYGFGMFFYLGRDVLVRVFYALGDGETPFKVSILNIFLNALLDFLLVQVFSTPGLILATVIVNAISMIMFMAILNRRLNKFPLKKWGMVLGGLTLATLISGIASWGMSELFTRFVAANNNFFLVLIQLCLCSAVALTIFVAIAMQLKLPELDLLRQKILKK